MKTIRFPRRSALLLGLGLLLMAPACTDRFDEINTDPTKAVDVPANLLFSRALKYGTLYDNDQQLGEHLHANMWVQFFANSTVGTNFNTDRYEYNNNLTNPFWNNFYAGYGMDLQQAIRYVQDSPEEVNKLSEARIWRVFLFQRMTDYWGDMPYTDAFKGVTEGNVQPNYDSQQAIYEDFLKELKESAAALDDTRRGNYGQADLLFGNTGSHAASTTLPAVNNRWRRFANSLRLRVAMRLSKADPVQAQQQVRDALASGVMTSNAESAIMKNTGGGIRINQNPLAVVLNFADSRVSATLVNYLTRYNDPRLNIFVDPVSGSNPARVGLPNGLSATQLAQPQYAPANFSQGGARYKDRASDQNLLTYAEVCFLRAEAVLRGWDNTGTAQSWYETGVRESMALAGVTDAAAITAYLNGPLVKFNPAQAQQQISTQKWLSLFGHNGFEAYAEYRRTGFPALQQIPSQGETAGQVPRRMRYHSEEARQNPNGYQQALERQGPDLMTTRIWWDKQ